MIALLVYTLFSPSLFYILFSVGLSIVHRVSSNTGVFLLFPNEILLL